jgi:hypothetical protein
MKLKNRIGVAIKLRRNKRRLKMKVRPIERLDKMLASGEKYLEQTAVKTTLLFVSALASQVALEAKNKALKNKNNSGDRVNEANQRYNNNNYNNNNYNGYNNNRSFFSDNQPYHSREWDNTPYQADQLYGSGPMY